MRAVPPSEPSLETVYTRHSTWLRHWLKGRLQCSETAADLMQDTFMRLLNRPRVFGSDGDARGYLTTIAKGLCVDFWRRRQIEPAYLEALTHQSIPMEASPEHKAIVVETLFELDSMLCRLPTKVSNAFLLSQLKGLTYREIAEQKAESSGSSSGGNDALKNLGLGAVGGGLLTSLLKSGKGSSLLKVGGAAAIGALAYKVYNDYQAEKANPNQMETFQENDQDHPVIILKAMASEIYLASLLVID
jgi:RNA polymerase sigma factor (sigma-70 family)